MPPIKIIRGDERTLALHEDQYVWHLADQAQLLEAMQQRGLRRGGVARQLGGPHDHLPGRGFGSCGDLGIVSADVDRVDESGGAACVDGALDQASAADPPKVLARHAFGAAAGGNDRDNSLIHGQVISRMQSAGHGREPVSPLRRGRHPAEEVVGLLRRLGLVPVVCDLADHNLHA